MRASSRALLQPWPICGVTLWPAESAKQHGIGCTTLCVILACHAS
jgi:hypothetical protein